MTLPDIPQWALEAAWFATKEHVPAEELERALAAAWPHLYAAALRSAAAHLGPSFGSGELLLMAGEAEGQ